VTNQNVCECYWRKNGNVDPKSGVYSEHLPVGGTVTVTRRTEVVTDGHDNK
jgi:hypothetical protein